MSQAGTDAQWLHGKKVALTGRFASMTRTEATAAITAIPDLPLRHPDRDRRKPRLFLQQWDRSEAADLAIRTPSHFSWVSAKKRGEVNRYSVAKVVIHNKKQLVMLLCRANPSSCKMMILSTVAFGGYVAQNDDMSEFFGKSCIRLTGGGNLFPAGRQDRSFTV